MIKLHWQITSFPLKDVLVYDYISMTMTKYLWDKNANHTKKIYAVCPTNLKHVNKYVIMD